SHTKIAPILKQHPNALDAIISINKKFEKLRNPILRKLMAGRTTLSAAANIGGCTVEDFFEKLEPLGFEIERGADKPEVSKKPLPAFLHSLRHEDLQVLDVRPVLASGDDPLSLIMETVKNLQPGQVLKIINTFEPTPLILLLEKKSFETYVDKISDHLIETYFHKTKSNQPEEPLTVSPASDWDQVLKSFGENVQAVDVRHLEMPQPMFTILEALDQLPQSKLLLVHHKRIPVFLLPELAQRGFEYRIKEIADGEVQLIIFK
ncbi:MAG: DUF2249 domain-containing protein, partial [Flavisolibacter sp.]